MSLLKLIASAEDHTLLVEKGRLPDVSGAGIDDGLVDWLDVQNLLKSDESSRLEQRRLFNDLADRDNRFAVCHVVRVGGYFRTLENWYHWWQRLKEHAREVLDVESTADLNWEHDLIVIFEDRMTQADVDIIGRIGKTGTLRHKLVMDYQLLPGEGPELFWEAKDVWSLAVGDLIRALLFRLAETGSHLQDALPEGWYGWHARILWADVEDHEKLQRNLRQRLMSAVDYDPPDVEPGRESPSISEVEWKKPVFQGTTTQWVTEALNHERPFDVYSNSLKQRQSEQQAFIAEHRKKLDGAWEDHWRSNIHRHPFAIAPDVTDSEKMRSVGKNIQDIQASGQADLLDAKERLSEIQGMIGQCRKQMNELAESIHTQQLLEGASAYRKWVWASVVLALIPIFALLTFSTGEWLFWVSLLLLFFSLISGALCSLLYFGWRRKRLLKKATDLFQQSLSELNKKVFDALSQQSRRILESVWGLIPLWQFQDWLVHRETRNRSLSESFSDVWDRFYKLYSDDAENLKTDDSSLLLFKTSGESVARCNLEDSYLFGDEIVLQSMSTRVDALAANWQGFCEKSDLQSKGWLPDAKVREMIHGFITGIDRIWKDHIYAAAIRGGEFDTSMKAFFSPEEGDEFVTVPGFSLPIKCIKPKVESISISDRVMSVGKVDAKYESAFREHGLLGAHMQFVAIKVEWDEERHRPAISEV